MLSCSDTYIDLEAEMRKHSKSTYVYIYLYIYVCMYVCNLVLTTELKT